MVKPRAIPCLLLKGDGLVKTTRFAKPTYIGDPINAVKLFNDLEADELMFLDITATHEGREPDYDRIGDIASEAFMPIGYGGGVRSVEQARRLFRLGVEKVVVTSAAEEDATLVPALAAEFGSQSIVAGIDVGTDWFGRAQVRTRSGSRKTGRDPVEYARMLEGAGAGEILLNSIDRDGTQRGFDLDMIQRVAAAVSVPLVACGGAGTLAHLGDAVKAGASAAAAGSLFVFTGPHRAVLINYPSAVELDRVFGEAR